MIAHSHIIQLVDYNITYLILSHVGHKATRIPLPLFLFSTGCCASPNTSFTSLSTVMTILNDIGLFVASEVFFS